MTVQELIDELFTYPKDRKIRVADLNGWTYDLYIGEPDEGGYLTIEPLADTRYAE